MGLLDDEDAAHAQRSAQASQPSPYQRHLDEAAARGESLVHDFVGRARAAGLPFNAHERVREERLTTDFARIQGWIVNPPRIVVTGTQVKDLGRGEPVWKVPVIDPTSGYFDGNRLSGRPYEFRADGSMTRYERVVLSESGPKRPRGDRAYDMRRTKPGIRIVKVTPVGDGELYVDEDGWTTCSDCVSLPGIAGAKHDSHNENHTRDPIARWMADALRSML